MTSSIVWILLSIFCAVNAVSVTYRDVLTEEWEAFKLKHNKHYKDDSEDAFRMKVFMENKHKIAKHNQKAANGMKSYTLGMNKYGDLLHHEFVSIMNGYSMKIASQYKYNGSTFIAPENVVLPKSIDWREKGAVTEVKDQGQCGSCWSFSTTGSLEGQNFRKNAQLVSLSEQNLIDCSTSYGNNGCNGGLMDNAFAYIKENHGIDTENSYPYEMKDDKCRFKRRNVGASDTGFVDIPRGSEKDLKIALATVGPVSVAIDASHESFQLYKDGVYDEEECDTESLDHGVLAVGYGTSTDGLDYYIVKNSWGDSWGQDGYIMMSRNKDNQCGIASQASYPLV